MENPQIYLIHDSFRKDRRELFLKEIETQHIDNWITIPAVKQFAKSYDNIAEAHKNCIRKAVAENYSSVVIMEDDVRFVAPGAYKRFLELSETLPNNWDIFVSGSYHYTDGKPYSDNILKVNSFCSLHCYMVSKRYYSKFLGMSQKGNIDTLLRGNIFIAVPMLALQHDTYSDNVKKVTNYNKTHLNSKKVWKGF